MEAVGHVTEDDEETEDDGTGAPPAGSRLGRLLVTVVGVGLVGMWAYVLYLAFFQGRQPPADRLEDSAFAAAAEVRCDEALDEVAELPPAAASPTAVDRAGVLDQANLSFRSMLDDLDQLATLAPEGEQRSRARAWLGDWRIYLGDRETYAAALRQDPEARLLISEKPGEGRHITGWIDEFAKANRMPSCATPGDA